MNVWIGVEHEEALFSVAGTFNATVTQDGLQLYMNDVMLELSEDEMLTLYNIVGFVKGLGGSYDND